ncbi:hypothetical protein C2845_PM17G03690 [Panicum miliaceum]|uniref:DUF4220 domain-containing protein n=1 Tax=Panicum miliaceum TaxID=4540 RepID=A0A3L6PZR3_PANMI|nr:hypothetical protein C2845_PM17G03690 [Panicum miliaceum]
MMIDVQSAILWWEEWQLRILVLGSLGIQWFLLLAAPMRKYVVWWWFRKCIWLAYYSSDALAIYALATLFNRHARVGRGGGGYNDASASASPVRATSLEVLWAPLLLVHLGGRDEITAYDIQDNELWTRHTVTVVSQVTVALYAFYKSWPGAADRRLLLSAIMLFISGVINFCEWALKNASMNRLVAVSSIMRGHRRRRVACWERWFRETDHSYKDDEAENGRRRPSLTSMDQVQVILSDISLLATVGNDKKRHCLEPLDPGVEMSPWLRRAFEIIYTRANVIHAPAYEACDFLLVPSLYIAAIALFATGRKQGYSATDVKLTYVFMVFTAVLDALGVFISKGVYKLMSKTPTPALCMTLHECSLIGTVARGTGCLLKRAICLGYEDYSSGNRFRSAGVAEFVIAKLVRPGRVEGLDLASYRSLTDSNWILGDELLNLVRNSTGMEMVRKSLCQSPFDESVLPWHIATDICFFDYVILTSSPSRPVLSRRESRTMVISNYMGYLLKFRPEMLMTGSRPQLFTLTMEDLEKLFEEKKMDKCTVTRLIDRRKVLLEIMSCVKEEDHPLIHDAYKLARELMMLPDEQRWKLMQRVWMGMLCYSGSMCRGYLHAKSLGAGGEFLSYIWIVITLMGAKTLADKLQMPPDKLQTLDEATTSGPPKEEEEPKEDIHRVHV